MESHYIINPAVDLGIIEYQKSLALQRKIVSKIKSWNHGDVLLILEHPPVFTIGRGGILENYKNVEVIKTERGGDVTYHGPGQIVVYPIINLEKNGIRGVRRYVEMVEQIIIDLLKDNGYEGSVGKEPGIWVNGKKVASIGMAINNGISFHGFSLNISQEVLSGFAKIKACGLDPSSISYINVDKEKIKDDIIKNFSFRIHKFNVVQKDFFYSII